MIRSLKELKKETDAFRSRAKYERDAEGRAVVGMAVRDDKDFLSAYSEKGVPLIDGAVAEFIEHRTAAILPREPLTLRIFSDSVDEGEKPIYRAAISAYYKDKYLANEREYRRNAAVALLLAATGIFVLALMIFLNQHYIGSVWFEAIEVVGWLFLWEASDLCFLENRLLKIKKLRYLSLIDMKVEYYPLREDSAGRA